MGIRPNRLAVSRCWHDPLPVHAAITEEIVGHICSKCLEACEERPAPPSHADHTLLRGGRLKP